MDAGERLKIVANAAVAGYFDEVVSSMNAESAAACRKGAAVQRLKEMIADLVQDGDAERVRPDEVIEVLNAVGQSRQR